MTPPWWGTLLYPTVLVGLFLGIQGLLALVGVAPGQRAALAALPAVAALLLSLPVWLRHQWGTRQPWQALGLAASPLAALRALAGGIGTAAGLLLIVVGGLALAHQLSWRQHGASAGLLLNGLALGAGVGLAEELLFRGWLLGELERQVGWKRAMVLQATLFSLVHLRWDLPPLSLVGLLGGLLLLGLALGLRRVADRGLLWGAVGLHGGLVGGWFVISKGLVMMAPTAPDWLAGPANPIGGVLGWLALAVLLLRPGGLRDHLRR